MTTEYNKPNIRDLLTKGFTIETLSSFCFDHPDFKAAYNQISWSAGQQTIVTKLLEYADINLRMETLLSWAKQKNPDRYAQHEPYYIDVPRISLTAPSTPTRDLSYLRALLFLAIGFAIALLITLAVIIRPQIRLPPPALTTPSTETVRIYFELPSDSEPATLTIESEDGLLELSIEISPGTSQFVDLPPGSYEYRIRSTYLHTIEPCTSLRDDAFGTFVAEAGEPPIQLPFLGVRPISDCTPSYNDRLPTIARSELIALQTYHNRFVTVDNDRLLRGDVDTQSEGERFILLHLDNGQVALKTSDGRHVTAMQGEPWALRAEATQLTKQGMFTRANMGGDTVALRTFYNRYISAMGADWDWVLRTETTELKSYEIFTIVPLQ